MVDLKNRIISLDRKNYPIKSFSVWWHTASGLYTELPEAVAICESMDLDPSVSIRAIPVAVGDNGIYEPLGG